MFDIKLIRDDPEAFDRARQRRGLTPFAAELIARDDARRAAIAVLQAAQERRNAASKEIGLAMREKRVGDAEALKAEVAKLKEEFPKLEHAERAKPARRSTVRCLRSRTRRCPMCPRARTRGATSSRRHLGTS